MNVLQHKFRKLTASQANNINLDIIETGTFMTRDWNQNEVVDGESQTFVYVDFFNNVQDNIDCNVVIDIVELSFLHHHK